MRTIERNILIASCFLLAIGFITTGLLCFWSDSEIWHLKISALQGDAREPYDYWIKPLFLLFMSVIYRLSEWVGVPHPEMGRWVFGLNGLLILFLGSRIVSRFHSGFRMAPIYFLTVGTSWIFLERGFRIRSDLLALSLFLLTLLLLVDGIKTKYFSRNRHLGLLVLFLLTIFVTPKSLLLFICFLPFLYKVFAALPKTQKGRVINLILLISAAIAGMSIASESFFISLIRQKVYLQGSLVDADGSMGLFSAYRWEHVINFLFENPFIWLPFLAKSIWIVKNWSGWWADRLWRNYDISFFLLVLLLVVFPNRTPFFICSLAPLFGLFVFSGTEYWNQRVWQALDRFRTPAYFLLTLTVLAGSYKMKDIGSNHNNLSQKQLYEVLKAFSVSYPEMTIYDPAGLSPSQGALHFYLGPGNLVSNQFSSERIVQAQPDIILFGQRMLWTKPYLKDGFLKQYKDFGGNGVYQKGLLLDPLPTTTKSRISGYHQVEMKEILRLHEGRANDIQSPIWILPLTREGNKLPEVIYELESGHGITQTSKGLLREMALKTKAVHIPEAATQLVVFERVPYLLGQFNMLALLRYDPEL